MTIYYNVSIVLRPGTDEPICYDRARVRYEGGFVIVEHQVSVKQIVQGVGEATYEAEPIQAPKRVAYPAYAVMEVVETPMSEPMS